MIPPCLSQLLLRQLSRPRKQVRDELCIKIADLNLPASRRLRGDSFAVAPIDQAADPVGGEIGRQGGCATVAVLAEVVREDADAEVRDEAAGVLLDIALGAYEADEPASLAAVEGLTALPPLDAQKQLVLVAKTARRDTVSRRAQSWTTM